MKKLYLYLKNMITILFVLCFSVLTSSEEILVRVKEGQIQGVESKSFNGRQILSFYGVPYAKPPVGNLRFESPEEPLKWDGVRDGTNVREPCLQYNHFTYASGNPIEGKEDCLHINIHTPRIGGPANLNVIVFFHGGAFTYGQGNNIKATYLMDKQEIILVTVNYRLGPLGFLSTQTEKIPGNNGLKDQLMALKWVNKNIAAFGGDTSKVTIAGMSAGSASVHYHLLSKQSRRYFSKAISMSGTALCPWAQTENANRKAKRLAENIGCPADDIHLMIDCLKKKPALQIVMQVKSFMPFLFNPFTPFGPVVEPKSPNAFIDESPLSIIKNKKAADVPWLVSFDADEGVYPGAEILGNKSSIKTLEENWDEFLPSLLDYENTSPAKLRSLIGQKIKQEYLRGGTIENNKKRFIEMISDRLYLNSIDKSLKTHMKIYSSPIYAYKFSYIGDSHISDKFMSPKIYNAAGHGDDFAYILKLEGFFHNENIEKAMRDYMINIWVNFINGGSTWPTVNDMKQFFPSRLTFLNIIGTDKVNRIEYDNRIGNPIFWNQLNFKEE